ncbi:tryptophan halogenase family protein [Thalassotalea mangrovi]|uniref:Tryptophan 7-halogenase n=1 Tax=Thalassotalea mangrovi TaxID=2572245 RepID=A0A4U1BB29_9GAMM|nr:tryptophan halogenase family protein [Thalassotalea mangrovi]TKB47378.1 tryptophan 7-halogenase [Thalassotalea mangrovi]
MNQPVRRIIIVGGGSAGWLSAGLIAAEHETKNSNSIEVVLIESANIPTVGVGEGTWPSMRASLKKMGISETQFLTECDASFKQGSKFSNWLHGGGDSYYHPFTPPVGFFETNIAQHWYPHRDKVSFADAVTCQGQLCDNNLAPKQIATPEYAFHANYGYHLDAAKFSKLLQQHCTQELGVKHILDDVTDINSCPHSNDIASVSTLEHGDIQGDLFIDCTGSKSLLLGGYYGVEFIDQSSVLFNDSALAVHVSYQTPDAEIASHTLSTAQTSGWIWDIGLPSRRGVGHVYASDYISDEQAEQQLRDYIRADIGDQANTLDIRKISIKPGHRKTFWHQNCVAVGMSAGFIEPLEASALALIEQSAKMIAEQLPANRQIMDITAKRFNQRFSHHWQRIIEFLKLHYVLSKRSEPYWQDNRAQHSIPEPLQELLTLWQYQTPFTFDSSRTEELFPAASFQYVLYGMGFDTDLSWLQKRHVPMQSVQQYFNENNKKTQHLLRTLPTNRELLNKIRQFGLSKV